MVWQQLDFFRTLQVKNSPAPNSGPDNAASALVDHLQQQAEHGNLRGDTLPVEAVPHETVGTAETSGAATDAVREGEGEASPVSETNREAAGEIPNLQGRHIPGLTREMINEITTIFQVPENAERSP